MRLFFLRNLKSKKFVTFIRHTIKLLLCQPADKEFYFFVKNQLGYIPRTIDPYREALTHKSALVKGDDGRVFCNERLEFLGDTILDSAISDYLFKNYKCENEGFLTQMRSKIVNRKSLNELALKLKLDKFLVSNNMKVQSNNALGNAFEALIGAMYLDKGFDFTNKFIQEKLLQKYFDFNFLERVDQNYKSRLIEIVQRNRLNVTFETVEAEKSSRQNPVFISSVLLDERVVGEGRGRSKKEAEQNASKRAISEIEPKTC